MSPRVEGAAARGGRNQCDADLYSGPSVIVVIVTDIQRRCVIGDVNVTEVDRRELGVAAVRVDQSRGREIIALADMLAVPPFMGSGVPERIQYTSRCACRNLETPGCSLRGAHNPPPGELNYITIARI
jgi:hypothetical protein